MSKKIKERDERYESKAKHLDAVICVAVLIMVVAVTTIALLWVNKNIIKNNEKDEVHLNETGHVSNESNYLETEESYKEPFVLDQEVAYKHAHFNNSWYNFSKYKAKCDKVDDSYFENVCFLGDSRTQGLLQFSGLPKWNGFFKVGTTAAAACYEREYTFGDGYYRNILETIEYADYDIFYVGYGTNDLGLGDADKFIQDLEVIIDKIKECHPGAIIYVENILPMGEAFSINHPTFSNENARIYNAKIYEMCNVYGDLIYLDIASTMRDDNGNARSAYISDGLHYNAEGYKVILNFIKGAVVEKKTM